ncbi:hypothetical protein GUITHDRAFT_155918, partial [Guillardia theta CCMP2712]
MLSSRDGSEDKEEGVVVTMEVLEQVFHLPLHKNSLLLGHLRNCLQESLQETRSH